MTLFDIQTDPAARVKPTRPRSARRTPDEVVQAIIEFDDPQPQTGDPSEPGLNGETAAAEDANAAASLALSGDRNLSPEPAPSTNAGAYPVSNLAEMMAFYDNAVSDHPRRSSIRSSLRIVARALTRPLEQIPADPVALRPLLARASPSMAGVKPRTWIQAKSTTLGALRQLGADIAPSRDATPVSAEWTSLAASLDRKLQIGLSRLLRFLSRKGVDPATVTNRSLEEFGEELRERSLRAGAETSYRQALRHWNTAVRTEPGWPQLHADVPRNPRHYSIEWAEFPASFNADVEAFLAAKRSVDPLSDDYDRSGHANRSVRAATDKNRRQMIRVISSALVLSSAAPKEAVTSLAVLTEDKHVRAALAYLRDKRGDGKIKAYHINLLWLLRVIARHWEKNEDKARALKDLSSALEGQDEALSSGGITEKNLERLRQFDIPKNIDLLVGLPERTFRSVRHKAAPAHIDCVRVMYALQVGILAFVPIRIKNLTQLQIGKNLVDVGKGPKRQVRIVLTSEMTKTHRDYQAPLPPHLYGLLDAWLSTYRPKVCDQPSDLLFPNNRGLTRSSEALSVKLSRFIERESGLTMNPHLFRHLAAKLYLDHDPTGIEIVRQLLGHTSVKTTLRVYAQLQTDPAFRRYEAAVLGLEQHSPVPNAPLRKGGQR